VPLPPPPRLLLPLLWEPEEGEAVEERLAAALAAVAMVAGTAGAVVAGAKTPTRKSARTKRKSKRREQAWPWEARQREEKRHPAAARAPIVAPARSC
jgi:hypothetical protein